MYSSHTHKSYTSEDLKAFLKIPEHRVTILRRSDFTKAYSLIDKFQAVENTFSFIIDFTTMNYLFASKSIEQVLGYKNWINRGVDFAISLYHPDDEETAKRIHEHKTRHTFSIPPDERHLYKYSHDFRIRHAQGHYIRINHHAIHIAFDDDRNPLAALCICNDVSDLKRSTTMNFEISKMNEEGNFVPVQKKQFPIAKGIRLSQREYEVLRYLADGLSNKDIAEAMFISEYTVKDHRKHMLRKNNTRTIGELISLAWKNKIF